MRLARLAALERKKIEDESLAVIQETGARGHPANSARVLSLARTSSPR